MIFYLPVGDPYHGGHNIHETFAIKTNCQSFEEVHNLRDSLPREFPCNDFDWDRIDKDSLRHIHLSRCCAL